MSLFNLKRIGAAALTLTAASAFSSVANAQDTLLVITAYLEGAAHDATTKPMRTDLWEKNLLDTNANPQTAQTPCPGIASQQIDASAFAAGSIPVDWVCVELRDSANTGVVGTQIPGVLLANGLIVSNTSTALKVTVDQSLQYHVIVHHRSHLSGASEAKPIYGTSTGVLVHDFTTQIPGNGPFFGDNLKQINGRNYLYAGDANQDMFIDGGDINFWRNGNGNSYVYRPHDVNLDGDITGRDKLLINPNISAYHYIPQ